MNYLIKHKLVLKSETFQLLDLSNSARFLQHNFKVHEKRVEVKYIQAENRKLKKKAKSENL